MRFVSKRRHLVLALCLVFLLIGTAAYGAPNKKIKIAAIAPMKFMQGSHIWMGAVLAAEQINKAGGVKMGGETYDIEVVKIDDNNFLSVADAVAAAEKAITVDKVSFLVGGGRSESVLAQQEIMAKYKTIFINTMSGANELNTRLAKDYEKYKYWFRAAMFNSTYTGAIIFAQAEMVARKIREELGITTPRVAVIAERVLWTDGIVKAAKAKLPQMGMEFVGAWRPSFNATDTTAELTAAKNAGAHMILIAGGTNVDTVLTTQYGKLAIPAAMVGMGTDSMRKEFWKTSQGNCNYLVISSYIARLPGKTFFDDFSKRWGTDPIFSALSYDVLFIIKNALEKTGTLETDAVIAALEKTDYQSSRGRVGFYPRDHKFPHDLRWGPEWATGFGLQWQDGDLKMVWPIGDSVLGNDKWKGVKFPGTVEYKLPPRMIKYWKGKK